MTDLTILGLLIILKKRFRKQYNLLFDRYGKLLKQLTGFGDGWNGTFNGETLPSSDYWFEIQLSSGKSIKDILL